MASLSHGIKLSALALSVALAGCGDKGSDDSLAALDAQLTNNAVDPALRGALEDQIVVDPKLAAQSNARAVKPADTPMTGAVPVIKGNGTAEALKLAGGKLLTAPEPSPAKPCAQCGDEKPATLGALAREQGQRQGSGCDARMEYGMQWAQRLPESFPLYPGAKLMDAGGADGKQCTLRAVSFVTAAPRKNVIDFYYTQAKRAGFGAEHQFMNGENVLGGVRASDDGAYFIIFAAAPGGGTAVDIVANNGR